MVDRHMESMARWLYGARYFHKHLRSAELQTRFWALLHNFWPYCPRAKVRQTYQSPAHKLNGFVYRNNWLENLLVATSLHGFRLYNKKAPSATGPTPKPCAILAFQLLEGKLVPWG